MNERFGWRRNVPPELRLSPGEWRNVRERFAQRRGRLFWKTVPIGILVVLGWILWKFQLEIGIFGRRLYGWAGFATMMLWIVLAQAAIAYTLRRDYARLIRTILRELHHDVCVNCGYWLRKLPDQVTHCPECGALRESMRKKSESQA